MKKTYLERTTILSVFDIQNYENIFLGKFLFGIVVKDETNRFKSGFRVITSKIKSQNNLEFFTKKKSCYVIDATPQNLDISFVEFIVMQHRLHSPEEILGMRQVLKLKDDRIKH